MLVDERIKVVEGDITKLGVEGIVNAANRTLLGGGGVDGAIHISAGPELLSECRSLGGCKPGEAKLTRGHQLPAQWVIHTVGPIWTGGKEKEPEILAKCYYSSLEIASERQFSSLAFPCISTGIYGYPSDLAASTAIKIVRSFLRNNLFPKIVVFCCLGSNSLATYHEAFRKST